MVVLGKRNLFWIVLAALAALGGAARLIWIVGRTWNPNGLIVDSLYYHRVANFVAAGQGFISPDALDHGHTIPTAEKAPLYPLVLAFESKLGATGIEAHRLLGVALGMAGIVLVGILGRRRAGPAVGLVAA